LDLSPGLLNEVPALVDQTCELARSGGADIAEHCRDQIALLFHFGYQPCYEILLFKPQFGQ